MSAEDLVVNNRCYWQAIKAICECLPESNVKASLNLVIESVNSINASALVISTEKEEVFGVFDLVSEEETDRL